MKTGLISKIIKMCIVVLIPLIAGAVIGTYAYEYYQVTFFDYYMDKASDDNTEERLVSYLEYINESLEYTNENEGYSFYIKENISNEHGDLFTIAVIRGAEVKNEAYYNKKGTFIKMVDNYYVTYYFAIYNVNYENLAKTLDPTEEHKLVYTELPKLSIIIEDSTNDEKVIEVETTTVANVTGESNLTVIYDYGYAPKKDSNNKDLNSGNPTSMRYYVLDANGNLDNFSSSVNINVELNSNWSGDDQAESEEIEIVTKDDFYNNKTIQDSDDLKKMIDDDFKDVYNEDIFAAGYTKYVIGRYIWWEVLITIILVEIVCGSFVLVWNAEEEKENQKIKKK